jgi:N-acetyl-anhydromuramyl-L-alanine amidase AmpD
MKEFFKNLWDIIKAMLKHKVEPEREPRKHHYDMPNIVVVKGVQLELQGKYRTKTGEALGLVVHYTVSGGSAENAQNVLKYLARRGLGCMVMDHDGVIYVAENVDLTRSVAWHAGTSAWRSRSGMSRYLMGMEICCWGKLDADTKPRVTGDVRSRTAVDNIKTGEYETYTKAQEKALQDFIFWQLDTNPEFRIDYVVGHDEIAGGRKSDPGASLSMTMPKYRSHLRRL